MDINILSPFVADLIAAGEVVERPSSVVKELLENSIDAGATVVTLELKGGGMTYIRVTDNGSGMTPEDAGIAFLRHATSKLRSPSDLEAIGTLGFRGEALAAIAAVSRAELMTRRKKAASGTRLLLEAGDIQQMSEHGCPEGTTIIIRDLFFNTPARLKFIKSDRAEAQSCLSVALKCALAHPEVSLRCIRDGREEFFSPGDGRADSAVYALLGRDTASGFLSCAAEDGGVTVSGFCSSPRAGRGNRSLQFFFVNGRPIKSATIQAALEQAYKNNLLVGKFPSCVLYLELSRAAVDVNVHPTKAEVKFSDERRVFDAVYAAVLGALQNERTVPLPAVNRPDSKPGPHVSYAPAPQKIAAAPQREAAAPDKPKPDFFRQLTVSEFQKSFDPQKAQLRTPQLAYKVQPAKPLVTEDPEPEPEQPELLLVGEAMNTYIIVQSGEELVLIDKHAAHERIIFDRLKAQDSPIMSQSLLLPVTLSPGASDAALLLENAELLSRLGFEIESYGADAVALRSIPADTDISEARPMLEELCEKLRLGGAAKPEDARDELLHTVACKAAIKAGRASHPEELKKLAGRVLSGEVKYCPHGRPVSVSFSKRELDKLFKRIV